MSKSGFYSVMLLLCAAAFSLSACAQPQPAGPKKPNPYYSHMATAPLNIPDAEWRKVLPAGVYGVARQEETERAYTGALWNNHKIGTYYCAACGNKLFVSATKFESGTGWPSFYAPAGKTSVAEKSDADGSRTEVECKRCGSHLGHVFNDGPQPTGLRYCMNSAVLDFEAGK